MWKFALLLLMATPAAADPAAVAKLVAADPAALAPVEAGWASANFGKAGDAARLAQLDALLASTATLAARADTRPAALAWSGMLLMTKAGIVRGLGGFKLVQEARRQFEAGIALDPRAAGGLALRQLGTLYWQVPGFPIAFGNDRKAEAYLKQALGVDRTSLANNLAMADFLVEKRRHAEAEAFLMTALRDGPHGTASSASFRGLRGEALAQMGRVRTQLGKPWNGAELAAGK